MSALNAAHTGSLPIGTQDIFLDELGIRTASWFESSISITIKTMKLLLTFVVCTVFDYLDAITFRAAIRDDTLDHDGAPPGQFFDTEYHLNRLSVTV
jgi:hypothetical protein